MAALRASGRGLRVLVVEKAQKYGGTSATSGGVVWIPNHGLTGSDCNDEQAFRYLNAVADKNARPERIEDPSAECNGRQIGNQDHDERGN